MAIRFDLIKSDINLMKFQNKPSEILKNILKIFIKDYAFTEYHFSIEN